MGLKNFFYSVFTGYDLEAEQTRGDDLDRELRELNERDYQPGGRIYERIEAERGRGEADDSYEDVLRNLDTGDTGDVTDQVDQSFHEGLDEGAGNIRSVLAAPFELIPSILKSIPWQLWLAGALVLFFYMGGSVWLARQLKGRLK